MKRFGYFATFGVGEVYRKHCRRIRSAGGARELAVYSRNYRGFAGVDTDRSGPIAASAVQLARQRNEIYDSRGGVLSGFC